MKLPKKVNLYSEIYEIVYFDHVDEIPGCDFHGMIDYEVGKIYIYRGPRSKEAMLKTLLHEILHHISEEQNMEWITEDKKHYERTVDTYARGLVDVLIRNNFIHIE